MPFLLVSTEDAAKLLDMVGHGDDWADNDCTKLVLDILYPALDGMVDGDEREIEVSRDQLYILHKAFTTRGFGEGGREMQRRLARAAALLANAELLGDIEAMPVGGDDADLPSGFNEAATRELLHRTEEHDA